MTTEKKKKYYTPKELAQELGVISEKTLQAWRTLFKKTGVLKGPAFHDFDGKIAYPSSEVEAYKERCRVKGSDDGFAA